uniref:Uncharacterized protein n=1 Tax=Tanacetum cinerariifolium TaxID=118510 RepID=A0A6L2NAD4_TANCI|nr:hypothetical protein [Tanacetum cinerariifolium]
MMMKNLLKKQRIRKALILSRKPLKIVKMKATVKRIKQHSSSVSSQFVTISAILGIIQRYMDQQMNEAVKVAVQIQSYRLCEEAQRENDEFLKIVDENMKKIIKEQVKGQVKKHISQASGSGADEGTGSIPGFPDAPTNESEEELSWNSTDDEGADNEGKDGDDYEEDEDDDEEGGDDDKEYDDEEYNEETKDEESFDPIPQTSEYSDDEGNGEEDLGLNVGGEEGHVEEDKEDELYKDVNINQGRGIRANLEVKDSHVTLTPVNPDGQQQSSSVSSQFVTSMLNPTLDVGMKLIFKTTSQMDVQTPTSVAPLPITAPTMTPSTIATITTTSQAPILPKIVTSTIIQNLPCFGSLFGFDNQLKTLEANFSDFKQMNQFAGAVSAIPEIVQRYMDQRINEAVKVRRRDDDADKDEESSVGPDRGSKRRREGKEPEPGSCKSLVELEYHLEEVFKVTIDQLDWVNPEGQQYPHNLLKPLPLIPNNRGRHVIPFEHFINNDLEYLCGGASSRKYTTSITKTKAADYGHIKRIIVVTELKIVEWHSYKHLDLIMVRRDDDKLYKFKEGNFKRLCIQDIEDMLLLLVQGKLTNLTVEERFTFNVSLRMFTRSIIIQRRVKDLHLGVESYQKKLNLTKPDSYRSGLKHKEAYTAYSNPRGFIYQNKDKKNRLMRIDKLHKFSDETLTDVRTTLDDRLKRIHMQYLQSIWRKSDKDRAAAMIQAIDKRIKTRRIMRSLEQFVRGRLYEGDFRMLQRTI